jgi:type I restriction enzyme, S subunit
MLAATQSKGVVRKQDYGNRTVTAQKDLHLLKLVEPGDYVISLRSFQGGIEYAHHRGIISPAYTVLKPGRSVRSGYYRHFFKAKPFIDSLSLFVTGIREGQNVDYGRLSRAELPLPSEGEQAAIVRFLDHANRRIDGFIRAKRKLIALLREQKQAIIHRAVTRGLNPNAPLKPSGIPWLGDIPRHWEVRRLKQCISRIEQGWSPQCDSQPAAPGEWAVLKVGCVNKDSFNELQNKRLPANLAPDPWLEVRDGDIMVSRANTRELLGLAALAESPRPRLMLCDKLFRFRPHATCFVARFLVMALRAQPSRAQIESSTNGASSSMQNIGQSVLKNLWLCMPPVDEQSGIVAMVLRDTEPLNTAIARTEREIALMQEYRTRLTADVVTGKLDVRAAAAHLPALPAESAPEPEGDEPIDDTDTDESDG